MIMKEFYKSLNADEKRDLAEKARTSVQYLSHIAHGHRQAGPELAKRLEKATKRRVTRKSLRPDIWG